MRLGRRCGPLRIRTSGRSAPQSCKTTGVRRVSRIACGCSVFARGSHRGDHTIRHINVFDRKVNRFPFECGAVSVSCHRVGHRDLVAAGFAKEQDDVVLSLPPRRVRSKLGKVDGDFKVPVVVVVPRDRVAGWPEISDDRCRNPVAIPGVAPSLGPATASTRTPRCRRGLVRGLP